ncbi:hypothetical protein LCGC14_1048940 [marine sediment metagenome]|uniref:Uncharacterized protein n=1 Tax=marine sediment metagenome TaxID=412755 RepID=A0A0F9MTU4_9ZZZZ
MSERELLAGLQDSIRELLEQDVVDCPHSEDRWAEVCSHCHGTRKAPGSTSAALLGVFREDCWDCQNGIKVGHGPGQHEGRLCKGSGYSTRSWLLAMEGEMEGALAKAVNHMLRHGRSWKQWGHCFRRLLDLLAQEGDTRVAACQEVLEAMRGLPAASQHGGKKPRPDKRVGKITTPGHPPGRIALARATKWTGEEKG